MDKQLAKIRKEFMKNSAATIIIQVIYPSVLLYLQQKFPDNDVFADKLFRLGIKLADKYLEDGDILRTDNLVKYLKAIYNEFLQNKKVQINKIDDITYHITDPKCILCGGTEIEGVNVHICTPFSGFFQKLLNSSVLKDKYEVNEFQVKTIASRWKKAPTCIHEIKLVKEV